MTPKEKAKDLIYKFSFKVAGDSAVKQCAKIAVEEILEILRSFSSINKLDYDYWIAVKQEILKSEN